MALRTRDEAVGAIKHAEDGRGYIVRFFETQGRDSLARLVFDRPVSVQETDILERPVRWHRISVRGRVATLPVGHDQIVTLRVIGLPDAGVRG